MFLCSTSIYIVFSIENSNNNPFNTIAKQFFITHFNSVDNLNIYQLMMAMMCEHFIIKLMAQINIYKICYRRFEQFSSILSKTDRENLIHQ